MRRLAALTLALLAATLAAPRAVAHEVLPARLQALLVLRVLGYDRALGRCPGGEVTIAVVHRIGDEAARDEMVDALREAARQYSVGGRSARVHALRWDPAATPGRLAADGACAVYFAGEPGADAAALARAAQGARALSFATTREAVTAGVAVGLVQRGARSGLLVSLAAARAAGAELDAGLLSLAEVLPGPAPGAEIR